LIALEGDIKQLLRDKIVVHVVVRAQSTKAQSAEALKNLLGTAWGGGCLVHHHQEEEEKKAGNFYHQKMVFFFCIREASSGVKISYFCYNCTL
jgi:hypothetical protein